MNWTTTKAVEGMTPYEAAFGQKPNLKNVCKWGEKVWVRVEGEDKLGGKLHEGRWMGVDEQSKGVRIYWPDKMTVGVECNVYFDKTVASVSHLKEEEDGIVKTKNDLSNAPKAIPLENPIPTTPAASILPQVPQPDSAIGKHICKPSQCILDITEGRGSSSGWPSDPAVAQGVQLPPNVYRH